MERKARTSIAITFGEEANKDLLIDFLNELLREEQGEITELQFLKTEQLGNTSLDRKAIFDLYCTDSNGERFIVELQKTNKVFYDKLTFIYLEMPKFNKTEDELETHYDWVFVRHCVDNASYAV